MTERRRAALARRVPWTLVVFLAAATVPWLGSRYDTFLASQIVIDALFAVSLNLLLGITGLVSFGHVAYFGVGAYVCGILMKTYEVPFVLAFPAAGLGAGAFALISGYFCVRLIKLYFAMLTLAFSQIVWAVAYNWNEVTGGDQGLPEIPYPHLDWMTSIPGLGDLRIGDRFYLLTLVLVAISIAVLRQIVRSPFGRMLTTIRDNPERAAFIGLNVRAYQLGAFVAVGGVSFMVETHRISSVIGPNGAGKSTLFNLITGHLVPDSGRVLLDGRDITGAPASHLPHGHRPFVSTHQHLPAALGL
jgi:branched-chain amino acid transport system permease protein